jgi:hypothetical protein
MTHIMFPGGKTIFKNFMELSCKFHDIDGKYGIKTTSKKLELFFFKKK